MRHSTVMFHQWFRSLALPGALESSSYRYMIAFVRYYHLIRSDDWNLLAAPKPLCFHFRYQHRYHRKAETAAPVHFEAIHTGMK